MIVSTTMFLSNRGNVEGAIVDRCEVSTVSAHDNSVNRPNGVHVCGDPAVTARPSGLKSKHGLSSVLKSCG